MHKALFSLNFLTILVLTVVPFSGMAFDLKSAYDAIAKKQYKQAIEIVRPMLSEAIGDDLGNCYYVIGYCNEKTNELEKAMENYLLALEHFKELEMQLRVNNNIAYILRELDLNKEALPYLNFIKRYGKPASKSVNYALYNSALALSSLEKFEEALTNVDSAISMSQARNDLKVELESILAKGLIYRRADEHELAKAHYQQLIDLHDFAVSSEEMTEYLSLYKINAHRAKHNLAYLQLSLADTISALENFHLALQLTNSNYERFVTLKEIGEIYYYASNTSKAKRYLYKAYQQVTESDIKGNIDDLEIYGL
ncbi:MAG: hypothetical protein AAFO69_06620, partial [Bacteroidota bacterium]